ncbi:hypothetical protein BGZ70_006986 [Mortierella alpina]|uniref:Uncharacterized protein n=1 Tax=Mortierella alpina TaxID=64518 RepID=A0A9P6J722_MORAP|nr:hypothetical protein BGZ70_006986 [Mortierella alpina]
MTQQQTPKPIFASFENRDVPRDEFPFPTEKAAPVSRDAAGDYEDKNQDQLLLLLQPWTPTDSTRVPYERRLWPLASRQAILRIFPHEKRPFYSERNGFHTQPYGYEESDEHEDDNDNDVEDDAVDDDDADEGKDIDKDGNHLEDEDRKGSRAKMEGTHSSRDTVGTRNRFSTLQEQRHHGPAHFEDHESQANTDRYYYEAMRWQEGVAKARRDEQQEQQQQQQQVILNDFDYLEHSPLLSKSPPPPSRMPQGRLIRRASVAKAKFYKLLHHNRQRQQQQSNHSPRQGTGDVDFRDQDVYYARDDVFEVQQEDEEEEEEVEEKVNSKGYHHHYHHDHHHDDNGFSDGSIHLGGGGGEGGLNSSSSAYSFTSSFRARVRLTRTKTVLRQVKQRLSAAARSMISEANKAAHHVGPLLRSNSLARYHRDQTRADSEEDQENEEEEDRSERDQKR